MKTLRKLKIAATVAAMCASVAGVHAASVSQSGGTLAMETIWPGTLAAPQSEFTRVRAPAVTFSFVNGPNAQANGSQDFQIVFTLGAPGRWAFAATAGTAAGQHDELVGALAPADGSPSIVLPMNLNAARTAETISAKLRGAVPASRIQVRGDDPPAGTFAIVLRSIDRGNTLPGSDPQVHTAINGNDPSTVTYRFTLVNRSNAPIALSDLDLTFNTAKAPGAVADYFTCQAGVPFANPGDACRQQQDVATSPAAEFGAIHNLATLVQRTIGNEGTGDVGCFTEVPGRISIRGNAGINNFQATEEFLNLPLTNIPTFNPSYLLTRRATDVVLAAGPNRLIATTNSFAENFAFFGLAGPGANLAPTNGSGGLGGGRYTFVPTTKAQLAVGFGPGATNPTVPGAVLATPSVLTPSSGDERDAALATVTFSNRGINASDRLMYADRFAFKGPAPAPLTNAAAHDFGTAATANLLGGVDINATAPNPALRMTVTQIGARVGTTLRLVDLAALPVGQQTCATSGGAGVTFTPTLTAPGSNVWNWDFSHADLFAAVTVNGGTATLAGKTLTVCYRVPGTVTIPAVEFRNATATLFKDDTTEQSLVSCPKNLAKIYGGVKVDVRNFNLQMVTEPQAGWMGILRVVNNSETDTAQVDAQYIWNNGTYGKWGTIIPTLPPRAAVYVNATQVVNSLTNNADSLPLNPGNTGLANPSRYDDVPTAALLAARQAGVGTNGAGSIRLRISADVPTIRVQNYLFNATTQALTEVSSSQGADFANIESSNRDHIDQDAQTDIRK